MEGEACSRGCGWCGRCSFGPKPDDLWPPEVFCFYCDKEMPRPFVMSAKPMCRACIDKQLATHAPQKAGAA